MESVNVGENDVVENVIELYDISFSFLAMHTSEMENLFDDELGNDAAQAILNYNYASIFYFYDNDDSIF